ncbi:MAG: hypothetical protein ACRDK9_08735 [Solirubrobacterales bacterium]
MDEISDSVARAFDRIDDFHAVQRGLGAAELLDAVIRLQESVGIVDDTRALLKERLEAIGGSTKAPGHVLLGLIIGLTAAELAAEAGAPRRA